MPWKNLEENPPEPNFPPDDDPLDPDDDDGPVTGGGGGPSGGGVGVEAIRLGFR